MTPGVADKLLGPSSDSERGDQGDRVSKVSVVIRRTKAALSVVSNICYPIENITKTTVEEVIAVAKSAIPNLNLFIKAWI